MTIKIATKIYLASTLLASVSLMVGLLGITSLGQYKHVVDEMQQVSAAALLGEQVNGLILSVVMDSRGIYMAGSPQESEKFAKPLLKSLDRLQLLLNEWQEAVPVGRRAAFAEAETATENFVRFRQELVRLSRESTLAEARSFGDNDANRQARSALNDSIKRLVTGNERELARLAALVDSDYDSKLRLLVLALGIGLSAGGLVAGFVVSRQVVQPLRRITATMHQLAAGDYSASIPYVTARDEIGTMAQAIEVFKNNGLEAERLRQSREEERARAGADRLASLQRMAEAIEQETRSSVDQVAALSVQLAGSAKDMSQSATVVEANSHTVADTAVQALGTAQAVAAAAEQLSASIHEISTQVNAATKITGRAVLASDEAQATIKKLSGAVSHIGDVAGLISDIAAQTNLLALNATIEAARAGEAGKGFAVVAGEVKNLANQTARATSEISAQLQEIRATTLEAVSAVQLINGAIAEVEGVSAAVAAAVEQQGAATQEIARNVNETSHAVSDVSTRIAHVSREAGASGTRAQQVGQIAEELASGIGALREVLVRIVRTSNGTVNC